MIRWKQPGDEAGIIELVRTQLVPLSKHRYHRSGRLRQDISERLKRGATLVVSGPGKSRPAAFVHMMTRNATLFVDLLAVHPSVQSQSWGTRLMNHAERYGLEQGCQEARLFVDDTNVRGMRFYRKLGYSAIRHIRGLNCYEMYKSLIPEWQ